MTRTAEAASHPGGPRPSDGPSAHRGGPGRTDTAPPPDATPAHGAPHLQDGTPARGVPRFQDGTPARGVPRSTDGGVPARGVPRGVDGAAVGGAAVGGAPRAADGGSARGARRFADGAAGPGAPLLADGTPARGVPRFTEGGSPARGVSQTQDGAPGRAGRPGGTPPHGTPRVRGGHPEQREPGGGWGENAGRAGTAGPAIPGQRHVSAHGPRQEYVDAFEADAVTTDTTDTAVGGESSAPRTATTRGDRFGAGPAAGKGDGKPPAGLPLTSAGGGKGRAFTGIAAAAVTTVLAVVVAGQVADGRESGGVRSAAGKGQGALRGDGRPTPSVAPRAVALTYAQKMAEKYPLSATLEGPGEFTVMPGVAEAPGKGEKFTYRVDVERGLGLDGELFAEAVQKTLNDDRSWAHDGDRTFERVASDDPDFVVTLASPGTTDAWCEKSGLDITLDNVSCDSALTERVMINAYRWAQGSTTYGDQIHAYRQMLINHEVGHRLGHTHVSCENDGDLAPVMQQQTKFLDHDGIHCLPNPWPYPRS
ncbi:DUF3152 domain-containing protein [Streptomyces griseoviridis]|uniref:DUF3152 domain-containing protein n=1 Tax=Streptomyces griseoviridis TaxID=45398 RepID=UPI00340A1122